MSSSHSNLHHPNETLDSQTPGSRTDQRRRTCCMFQQSHLFLWHFRWMRFRKLSKTWRYNVWLSQCSWWTNS